MRELERDSAVSRAELARLVRKERSGIGKARADVARPRIAVKRVSFIVCFVVESLRDRRVKTMFEPEEMALVYGFFAKPLVNHCV